MAVLARAITWATLFIGFVLVFLPARMLATANVLPPSHVGLAQVAGVIVATAGGVLALWCIATFAVIGRGTPAPFDPPRQLVGRGPYRYVRNPMYLGAALFVAGGALYYETRVLLLYSVGFLVLMHAFVIAYEEPTLRATFGEEYAAYCKRVRRWWPIARL